MRRPHRHVAPHRRLLAATIAVLGVGLASPAQAAPVAEDEFARQLHVAIEGSLIFEPGTTLSMASAGYDDDGILVKTASTVNPDGSLIASVVFPDSSYDFRCTSPSRCWVRSGSRRWQRMTPNAITRIEVVFSDEAFLGTTAPVGSIYDITASGAATMFTTSDPGGLDMTRSSITVTPRSMTVQELSVAEDPITQALSERVQSTVTFTSVATPVAVTAPAAVRPGRPTPSSYVVLANPRSAS